MFDYIICYIDSFGVILCSYVLCDFDVYVLIYINIWSI